MTPEILYTLLGIGLCLSIGSFSYHMHAREHNKLKPRMVPWIIISMGCVATGFMLIVHLANLLGLETGNRR